MSGIVQPIKTAMQEVGNAGRSKNKFNYLNPEDLVSRVSISRLGMKLRDYFIYPWSIGTFSFLFFTRMYFSATLIFDMNSSLL